MFFLLVRGIVAFLITDFFGQAENVFPLYLGSAVLIELLAISRLKNKPLWFGAVGGLLIATVGSVTELLWAERVFQFPWAQDMWAEGLAMTIPVGIAAGLCGALFALGLQGRLPRPAIGRSIMVGSVLVTAIAVGNGLHATVPKNASATFQVTAVGTQSAPEITASVELTPGLVDDHPTWVQITAWQGGGEGVVTDRLKRTGDNTWESTKPVPIGGNWKTLLRVQDGRMLTAVPIYLPADEALGAEELPTEASFTRPFIPEIDILQRERNDDHPAWLWGAANLVVLLCSLGIVLGIGVAANRIGRAVETELATVDDRATSDV